MLPQWVYRKNSCPDPYNISMWITASKRINCFHKLTSVNSNEQAMVYHCMPSSFLNETVEFCGRNVPVAPGTVYTTYIINILLFTKELLLMRLTCRNIHVGKSGHISTIPVFKMFFNILIFFKLKHIIET